MSIASEISRLQTAKADLKTAIESKGVTVPSSTKLDGYADLVDSIETGGGGQIEAIFVNLSGKGTNQSNPYIIEITKPALVYVTEQYESTQYFALRCNGRTTETLSIEDESIVFVTIYPNGVLNNNTAFRYMLNKGYPYE